MILCDLCGNARECKPRAIEGREYDICATCWNALAEKLKGKGREIRERETVFLPAPQAEPERPAGQPPPGHPPKIWSSLMAEPDVREQHRD